MTKEELKRICEDRDKEALKKLTLTKEGCLLALEYWPRCLRFLKENSDWQHAEVLKKAVEGHGLSLADIPEDKQTLELCDIATTQNIRACQFVSPRFRNQLNHKLPAMASGSCSWFDGQISGVLLMDYHGEWVIAPLVDGKIDAPRNSFGVHSPCIHPSSDDCLWGEAFWESFSFSGHSVYTREHANQIIERQITREKAQAEYQRVYGRR